MLASPSPERKRCFDPVVDAHTRLLVLGSLPGEQSLARQEYYGNKQNRFWMLMSEVTGKELVPLAYAARLAALRASHVGLWDVVAQAHREGSLDSNIRTRDDNDLLALIATLPQLKAVAFNGGTAARLGLKVLGDQAAHLHILSLPSSSPAYTLAYASKRDAWLALRAFL
ncbi:DNA-deoxyinosine glycosylase [Massilia sp. CF038]|uniref:DNA-deoxyinosine glycosylase n=1 Tax=Massilia sp. CF038 TaxID=1881045 RepID=UPI000913AE44|nr:DNA-deoxyinosine glycosylase [Massilia sp. CF038]SHH50977.1 G/U mismatch-specific uracil-DNA glycosylase [Massilia sp. CF038]